MTGFQWWGVPEKLPDLPTRDTHLSYLVAAGTAVPCTFLYTSSRILFLAKELFLESKLAQIPLAYNRIYLFFVIYHFFASCQYAFLILAFPSNNNHFREYHRCCPRHRDHACHQHDIRITISSKENAEDTTATTTVMFAISLNILILFEHFQYPIKFVFFITKSILSDCLLQMMTAVGIFFRKCYHHFRSFSLNEPDQMMTEHVSPKIRREEWQIWQTQTTRYTRYESRGEKEDIPWLPRMCPNRRYSQTLLQKRRYSQTLPQKREDIPWLPKLCLNRRSQGPQKKIFPGYQGCASIEDIPKLYLQRRYSLAT